MHVQGNAKPRNYFAKFIWSLVILSELMGDIQERNYSGE
jgi:hypothetical protein